VNCPVCQSKNTIYKFISNDFHGKFSKSKNKFKYYQCQNCLTIFPDISKVNLKKYYDSTYRHKINFIESILINTNYKIINLLIKIIFKNKKISVLDVGCGNGNYLKQLPKKYKTLGIDIKIDKENPKLIESDFIKYKFKNKFDLIIFSHSLEHFINPIMAINKAKKLLNNKGIVIISIPISDSLSFKINPSKAYHLDPPRHIFIPNSKLFNKILLTYFSSVKTLYHPFEFILDLFWTIYYSKNKLLLPFFPILKIIFPETKLFICRR